MYVWKLDLVDVDGDAHPDAVLAGTSGLRVLPGSCLSE
jgi:hypothetical protein